MFFGGMCVCVYFLFGVDVLFSARNRKQSNVCLAQSNLLIDNIQRLDEINFSQLYSLVGDRGKFFVFFGDSIDFFLCSHICMASLYEILMASIDY